MSGGNLVEDKLAVSESYGGTSEAYLKPALGMVPKHDPVPLATLTGSSTSLQRRGLVRTEYTHQTLRENLRAF